jgi:hypothetical protein
MSLFNTYYVILIYRHSVSFKKKIKNIHSVYCNIDTVHDWLLIIKLIVIELSFIWNYIKNKSRNDVVFGSFLNDVYHKLIPDICT